MNRRNEEYQHAREWMRALAGQSVADVVHRPGAGPVFIDVIIEGQRFQGRRDRNTLYIVTTSGRCALGVACINQASRYDHMPKSWHICKYWNEATCELALSPAGMRALAVTFGLPILPEARLSATNEIFEVEHFYDSPAFAALHEWAKKVPRRVAGAFGDGYLGLWPMAALAGDRVPSTAENLALARARVEGSPQPP